MGFMEKGARAGLTWWMISAIAVGVVSLIVLPYLWLAEGMRDDERKTREKGDAEENSLVIARDGLAKNTDITTCRSAVLQINSYLANHPDQRPQALSADQKKQLQDLFTLDEGELNEV